MNKLHPLSKYLHNVIIKTVEKNLNTLEFILEICPALACWVGYRLFKAHRICWKIQKSVIGNESQELAVWICKTIYTLEQRNINIIISIPKVIHWISPSCYPVISVFPTWLNYIDEVSHYCFETDKLRYHHTV